MKLYGAISKVEPQDDGTIRVYGIASTETVDADGETVLADAIRQALPDYMKFPAIREMHQLSAAGTALDVTVGDDNISRIIAHVVDPIAVKKVTEGVYRGFSIGGKALARDATDRKVITSLRLTEISLVDRPSCPDAVLDCWKADSAPALPSGDPQVKTQNTAMADALVAAFVAGQEIPMRGELLKRGNAPGTPVDGKDVAPPVDGDPVDAIKPGDSGENTVGEPVAGHEAVSIDPDGKEVEVIEPVASDTDGVGDPVDGKRPAALIPDGDGDPVQVINPAGEVVKIDNDLTKADEAGEDDPIVKRKFTAKQRKEAAKSGAAMADGSYTIENKADLENAVQALGRAKDRDATIKHIKRRAKALDIEGSLPDWMGKPTKKADVVERHVPGQVWTCGDPEHQHLAKAEATRCVDQQEALAKAAKAAEPAATAVANLRDAVGAALASAGKEIAKVSGTETTVRKGLYTLSDLAVMVLQLRSMVCNVDYEETAEQDAASPLPQLMRDALKSLVAAFRAMSEEETAELLESVSTNTAEVNTAATFLYMASHTGDIAKAGRRHSKADMDQIQKAHDILNGLGAVCSPDDDSGEETDKVAKALAEKDAELAEIKKVLDEVDPLAKAVSALGETITELRKVTENQATEIAKLKAEPAPAKTAANLHAVLKAADTTMPETDEGALLERLAKMTDEDRGLLLAKAALRNPMPVRFGGIPNT